MKNKIFILIFSILLVVGISGVGFNPNLIEEFTEAGAELIGSDTINFGEGEYDIGNLIEGFEKEDISVSNVRVEKKEENNRITFLKNGNTNIKGDLFENVEALSYIEVDNKGNIKEAFLKAGEGGSSFIFDGNPYHIPEGGIIEYKDGEIIVKESDSFEFGDKESNELTKVNLLGESIKVKNVGGDYIITGNSKIGNNEILGIGENIGKATVSRNGKILEVWGGTEAKINGIECSVSQNNVNLYFEKNFNPLEHKGENYFNYEEEKIALGGTGFTANLGEENAVFGDMKTKKYIDGQENPKTRNLEITLNGGNLEISKDKNIKSGLAFNAQGDGGYVIDLGRAVIRSEKDLMLEKQNVFVKTHKDKEGLLYSYDLNLNEGEYVLENNLFKDKKGNVLMNTNKDWENSIKKSTELNIEFKKGEGFAKEIEAISKELTGVRPRYYLGFMNEEQEEEMLKWMCEAVDSTNQNIFGTKISLPEFYTRYMGEGGSAWREGYPYYDYKNIGHDAEVWGSRLGMDYIASQKEELEEGGFLSKGFLDKFSKEDAPRSETSREMNTLKFDSIKESLFAFAGEYARRKHRFEQDCINHFGKEECNKMSDNEIVFWVTQYFNRGEAAGKGELTGTPYQKYSYMQDKYITVQGAGRENVYKPWVGPEPSHSRNAHFNAVVAESTYNFLKESGIFNHP